MDCEEPSWNIFYECSWDPFQALLAILTIISFEKYHNRDFVTHFFLSAKLALAFLSTIHDGI